MRGDADVIIVGSGPAGGSAAYFLRQFGFRVLVVEKERLPRYKVCAGGVPHAAMQEFPFSFSPVVEQWIQRMSFIHGKSQTTHHIPRDSLAMVMRDRFDQFIIEHSRADVLEASQVTLVSQDEDQVSVQVQGRSRPLRASFAIGADGANSRVAQSVGLRRTRNLGAALEAEVEPGSGPGMLESFRGRIVVELGAVDNGYAWVFPKASHLSVGLGSTVKGTSLHDRFTNCMTRLGIDLKSTRPKGHPLPVYTSPAPLHKGRILLAGDAAGLVDPLTGEGIRPAIDSGRMAAQAIASHQVKEYSRRIDLSIGRDMIWASRFAQLLYAWTGLGFHWLVRHKLIFQDLIRITNSRLSYRQAVKRVPLYMLTALQRARLER
ncbi:MAG: geranylgeranyl reductase family protein [Desulfovermiculus sp.]